MKRLSKSRIMSALQCPKRLYLEVNHRELAKVPPSTEAAFVAGHEIGEIARQLYDDGTGILIEYDPGLNLARRKTAELMRRGPEMPIFEATFLHAGVLVRVDVLLPTGSGWRIVEVKSSTRLKDEHLADCAIQSWVFQQLGYPLDGIALAHVDNRFVFDGSIYRGLLTEHDVEPQVAELLSEVPDWIDAAQAAVAAEPAVEIGTRCNSPYPCPFFDHCWPTDAEYPVTGLRGGLDQLADWVRAGYRDIREIPPALITNTTQQRIRRVTDGGSPELLPGLRHWVAGLGYPRYYLDFETVAPAVPVWPDTSPYEALPVQFSCHIEEQPDRLRHEEFLDLSGAAPMRPLAEALIATLGRSGPVLMYSGYERRIIRALAERFPDLAPDLESIEARLVDLLPPTRQYYYHPRMLGSWSIKAVIPTIDPAIDYRLIDGIKGGTEASAGFLEAVNPVTTPERKRELDQQLRRYCRIDTEAMVSLVRFFESAGM